MATEGLSRRDFLKLTGAATGSLLLPAGAAVAAEDRPQKFLLHKQLGETHSICPFCAVGCGMIISTENGKVVNIEGDPDHPINRGALCSKGETLVHLAQSPERVTKPLYRAPGASDWKEVEWDWAIEQIARRVKDTRDANWTERDEKGRLVNHTKAIAHVGSAALDNEECAMLIKALRAMGLIYIEHQARI
jgi:formate dehydrogenase major subunit